MIRYIKENNENKSQINFDVIRNKIDNIKQILADINEQLSIENLEDMIDESDIEQLKQYNKDYAELLDYVETRYNDAVNFEQTSNEDAYDWCVLNSQEIEED